MLRYLIIDDQHCKADVDNFIERNRDNIKSNTFETHLLEKVDQLQGSVGKTARRNKILVSTSDTLNIIDVDTIVRCESNRNYTTLFLENNKTLLASKTLMDFEQSLTRHYFLRIHKSHLVNVNYIEKYLKTGGGNVLLKDGTQLPVAVRKKEYLFRQLEKL